MSLVAYGSSDESSDGEVNAEENDTQNKLKKDISNTSIDENQIFSKNRMHHMCLPVPKNKTILVETNEKGSPNSDDVPNGLFLSFGALPKPRNFQECRDIPEEDDIPLFKPKYPVADKPIKKDRTPARISIPSMSEFKDVDEDLEQSRNKPTSSKTGTGLFSILPPPKNEISTKKNTLIPHVLTKLATASVSNKTSAKILIPSAGRSVISKGNETGAKKTLPVMDYDSNSEDDDEPHRDFFSLSKPMIKVDMDPSTNTSFFTIPEKRQPEDSITKDEKVEIVNFVDDAIRTETVVPMDFDPGQNSTLVSTVMNLPREEIFLKNKVEVGPKLPIPEQEFNVDSEGNVAFDEKAIEYLCGKRGVKRKNQMIEEANIIEINGEDIKPDEREWLVKALTEEPVQRPVSMQGAGPSSQSKKKHQITYLAHQAKAMEVELKNTWSQNRMAKKQTQSKYGF